MVGLPNNMLTFPPKGIVFKKLFSLSGFRVLSSSLEINRYLFNYDLEFISQDAKGQHSALHE